MRNIIILLIFVFSLSGYATTYYVSNSGNDSNNGLTEQTSWQTLERVQTLLDGNTLKPYDVIAFRGGDEFYGVLKLVYENNLIITSYGTGQAIITGEKAITGWVNQGGHIWKHNTGKSTVYHVSINNKLQSNSRLPNAINKTDILKNFLMVESKVSSRQFKSKDLIGVPNLAGAKVFMLSNPFTIRTGIIKSFNSNTGDVTVDTDIYPDGSGSSKSTFWISNHPNLLKHEGSWYWDETNKDLYVYSATSPTNVKIISDDLKPEGITIAQCNNITIDNLQISGYYKMGIKLNTFSNIIVKNSTISRIVEIGLKSYGGDSFIIENNIIEDIMSMGTHLTTANSIIENNLVQNIGIASQLSYLDYYNMTSTGEGIASRWSTEIRNNKILYTGRNGIYVHGKSQIINNYILNPMLTTHDAGGIYTTEGGSSNSSTKGMEIKNNIIIADFITPDGWASYGIYADDDAADMTISGNSISGFHRSIFSHNNQRVTYDNNTLYKSNRGNFLVKNDNIGINAENNIITNNEMYNENEYPALKVRNSINESIEMIATSDNNIFFNPTIPETVTVYTKAINEKQTSSQWQTFSSQDTNSVEDNVIWGSESKSYFAFNKEKTTRSIVLPAGNWYDLQGSLYTGSITLQAYSSKILITEKSDKLINANAGEDVAVCSGDSTTLTASGGSSYTWTTGATTQSITVSPTTTQTYTVTVTDGIGNSDLDEVIVTVNNVTANAGANVTINEGESTTLTASGGDAYLWSTGATTESIIVTPTATLDYTVTVTKNGCNDIDSVKVIVNPTTGSVKASAGADVSICNGESTILTATGGTTYLWSTGATTASITISPASTQTYTVTATDGSGNTGSDDVIVTVNSITANAGANVTITEGESTTLTATGGDTYSWSNGATTQSITVSPTATKGYTVTVTKNGCQDTDRVTITVNPINLPVTASAGADVSICDGESATLTASGGATYLWSTGATTTSITVSPTTTKTYTVTATDGSGNTGSDDVIVTANSVTANAGANVTITEGESTTLTATGGDTYSWSNGATTQSITVSPTATKGYTVTVTKNGCQDTDRVTVTVNPINLPVTASAGADVSICDGESATLTASGGATYLWSTGATTASITVSPTTTKTYTVTAKDGSGNTGSDDVIVTVNRVKANAGADITINEGENVTLTASGGDTYLWSTGATSATITVSPTATKRYTVWASKNGCEDKDGLKVTVIPITEPTTVFASAGANVSICNGESTTLTASGGSTYVWSTGATTTSITVSPNTTKTYTVTATDTSGNTESDDVIVTVNRVKANAGADITINEGENVTLTASGGDTYLWSTGATTATITVSPTATKRYTVWASKNGCEDKDGIKVTVANEIMNASPADAFAGDDISICLGESVTLNASGGDTYTWSTGDANSNIDVNPTRTTTYTLSATRGGITDTDTVTVSVENCNISALPDDVLVSKLSIYPNPTTGVINVNINNLDSDMNVELISLNGSLVYKETMFKESNGFYKVDLSRRLAKGIYFIRLFNANQYFVKKIMLN